MMKKQILLPLSCAILSIVFFSMISIDPKNGGDLKKGKNIFNGPNNCYVCHGPTGKPIMPGVPSFYKGERLEKTDATLMNSIRSGIAKPKTPGTPPMPAFGGGPKLTDIQLMDVIAHIRSLKK